jgi:DNA-binding HxlR family transcriptional regulator
MSRQGYLQYCPVAAALDVVGERWTLLLVRELLLGPRRFGDLLSSLPGLGTSLLSSRLKQLERDGVVERDRLGPPANVPVYRLTERGAGLGPVVVGLARWGRGRLAGQAPAERTRPELLGLVLAVAGPGAGIRACIGVELADEPGGRFHLRVDPGEPPRVRVGPPAEPPDAVVRTDLATLAELALTGTPVADLEARGALVIDAPAPTADQVRALFTLTKESPT